MAALSLRASSSFWVHSLLSSFPPNCPEPAPRKTWLWRTGFRAEKPLQASRRGMRTLSAFLLESSEMSGIVASACMISPALGNLETDERAEPEEKFLRGVNGHT